MSDILTLIIAGVIIGGIFGIIFAIAERNTKKIEAAMDADDFILRLSNYTLALAIILTIPLLAVLVFVDLRDPAAWLPLLILLPCLLVGPVLTYKWFKWKIIVKGNQITCITTFGKEKTYTFDHITTVKRGKVYTKSGEMDCIKAYHGKKKLFTFADNCRGFSVLAARLESEGVFIIGLKDKLPPTDDTETL
jgi:hypothetical protein